MARKSPAFSFYADSWIGGTMRMPPLQRAAYIDLMANQWLEGPFTLEVALMVSRGVPEKEVKAVLQSKFSVSEEGLYFNARLEEERKKQAEFHSKQSANGKKGGRPLSRQAGFVYAMQRHSDGLIKLGCSVDPKNRASQIKSRAGCGVTVLAVWQVNDMLAAESVCHGYFAKHRKSGEWFAISGEMLTEDGFINQLKDLSAVDVTKKMLGSAICDDIGSDIGNANAKLSDSDSDSVLVLESESNSDSDSGGEESPPAHIGDCPKVPFGLLQAWRKWEGFILESEGKHIGSIEAETTLLSLLRRGEEKAIRDIEFSIFKRCKTIRDSDNDFDKPKGSVGPTTFAEQRVKNTQAAIERFANGTN